MMEEEIKIGDIVTLLDDSGLPYKSGIVDKIDIARGRCCVKTTTSYACWNLSNVKKS